MSFKLIVFVCVVLLCICVAVNQAESPTVQSTVFDGEPTNNWFDAQIPEPFFKLGSKYYYFELNRKGNWWDAVHQCRQMNAQLVTVESSTELELLHKYIRDNHLDQSNFYWMAAHDHATRGTFVSIATGLPITYTNWSPGNPDKYNGNEHCAHLWIQNEVISMNDHDCVTMCNYICQANQPKTLALTIW